MSAGFPSQRAYTFRDGNNFPSGSVVYWNNETPDGGTTIVLQIYGNPANPSNVPIREVYIPVILGPIAFYFGKQGVSGTPDYVTQGSGCECVDFDSVFFLTLQYQDGYPGPAYLFLRSLPTGAFRQGAIGAQVTSVRATEPLVSSGGNSPIISLDEDPLPIAHGGTGTTNPQLIQGTGITITGTPFNWTISAAVSGIQSITFVAPLQSTGGSNPTVTLGTVPIGQGGTGQTNPQLNSGAGISVTGNVFQPSGSDQWIVTNTGVLKINPGQQVGAVLFESTDSSIKITSDPSNNALDFSAISGTTIADTAQVNPATLNSGGSVALQIATLPGGQWLVEAICHGFGLTSSGNQLTMTGTGFGPQTPVDTALQQTNTRTLYFAAVVGGGNQPTVTLTSTTGGVFVNTGTSWISLSVKAFRIT